MKTMIYTAMYLLLAGVSAYISVAVLGMAGMGRAIGLMVIGFALVGASAFTAAYSRWWGEQGGQRATIISRNLLGIPIWVTGFVLAWLEPSSMLFEPVIAVRMVGVFLIILGAIPFVIGHIALGWRTHMPSVSDTLVRDGLYAHARHPIYSGGFAIFTGLALVRPTSAFMLACLLGVVWLIIQARLEEMDLLDRMPDYRDYMMQVPRFLPRFRR